MLLRSYDRMFYVKGESIMTYIYLLSLVLGLFCGVGRCSPLTSSSVALGLACAGQFDDKHKPEDCASGGCNNETICMTTDQGSLARCYTAWKNVSGIVTKLLQGCWYDGNSKDCHYSVCIERAESPKHGAFFCCCDEPMCNMVFEHKPVVTSPAPTTQATSPKPEPTWYLFLYTLGPLVVISAVITVCWFMYSKHKLAYQDALSHADTTTPLVQEDFVTLGDPLKPLQLLELKARGRFGCVWKAQHMGRTVAVKQFPMLDRQSFTTEREVYSHPLVQQHPNILKFISAERHGAESDCLNLELWLITEFHPLGSLFDYLKSNTISLAELLRIGESMLRGLVFLHSDIPAGDGTPAKSAIAHRDFKSKNVLLKEDLTACVADFGLALKFTPGEKVGDTHAQVGTRRYMAPEVLEGAITFNRDSFLRIDMYACSLVLWELLTRCSEIDGPVESYHLPYEEEVGAYPSLEDLQELVVNKKGRPKIKDVWQSHKVLAVICVSAQECWDHDPEARLTADCVEERLAALVAGETLVGYIQSPPYDGGLDRGDSGIDYSTPEQLQHLCSPPTSEYTRSASTLYLLSQRRSSISSDGTGSNSSRLGMTVQCPNVSIGVGRPSEASEGLLITPNRTRGSLQQERTISTSDYSSSSARSTSSVTQV